MMTLLSYVIMASRESVDILATLVMMDLMVYL